MKNGNEWYGASWRALIRLLRPYIRRRFNCVWKECAADGPCIVISNHVTNWDPFFVAMSFPEKPLTFVASEHLFRLGIVTKAILKLVRLIPRPKGAPGAAAAVACARVLRQGGSVCLFAEGDCTWDGVTHPIFASSGGLVKASKAALVTYRLEGGYFTAPRWGRGIRRGVMHGHPVRVVPPETLARMTVSEIDALIERDIFEDAWARQKAQKTVFRGKTPAERLETALWACPACGGIGRLASRKEVLACACGMRARVTPEGIFAGERPFRNAAEWDTWQWGDLRRRMAADGGAPLFGDDGMVWRELTDGHGQRTLLRGAVRQLPDALLIADTRIPLTDISGMAMVKTGRLIFTANGRYTELRARRKDRCLRKYLAAWEIFLEQGAAAQGGRAARKEC